MSLRGKRVLVSGGSGFIGSHLCRRLIEMEADVFVLVKYHSVIDNVRLAGYWDHLTPVEVDLRNPDSLRALQDIRPQVIFHLAAYNHVGSSFTQVSEALDCNGKGAANLLEAYEGYERFIHISSSEVYGYQPCVPFREDAVPQPQSPYAVGKYLGEVYALMKWRSAKRPIVVLRPFNAYGPYQSPRAVIAELIIRCLRGEDIVTTRGLQTREFNYVENLIDGFLLAAASDAAAGQVINLGCGVEISIRDLVKRIHRLTQSASRLRIGELPDRPGEIWRMCADSSRAKTLLGWTPTVGLEQGLERTVAWYRRYLEQFGNPASALAQLGTGSGSADRMVESPSWMR